MTKLLSRRFFLGTALSAVAGTAFAAPPAASLRPVLRGEDFFKRAIPEAQKIIGDARLSGQVAYAVAEAVTGQALETLNPAKGTPPASVTKALTALYALDLLGPAHRFETQLIATGGVENGQVLGDLVLVGGGDPTLDTDGLADMAAGLKAAGIIEVKGAFKVYHGALPFVERIDRAQPDHVGYNPAVSGIALNFNRVHFEWRRANGEYGVTMEGRSASHRPAVQMARMRIEDRGAPVYTYADGGNRDDWTVARGALGRGGARWLPIRKPALYAGDVFATLSGAHGIRLKKPQVVETLPAGEVLFARSSAPLREILRGMLKYSTNLTAEMVGMAASRARGAAFEGLAGSAGQMNLWAVETLGMQQPGLVDHSGLGEASRLTAQDMVRALVTVQGSDFRNILKPVFLRDEKGRPQKDHPITIAAKTGTLNFVSSLAGYLTGPDGTEMAFAIFAGDLEARANIPKQNRESPRGAKSFNNRARRVQRKLLERWGVLYGA